MFIVSLWHRICRKMAKNFGIITLISLVSLLQAAKFDFRVQRTQPDSSGSCHIPEQWKGQWYQNGYRHPLEIKDKSVTGKGQCMDVKNDNQRTVRFLFRLETKTKECWRCVIFFSEKNAFNVLQYKETSCMAQTTLDKACLEFYGDNPLFTLFRADAKPEPCPIQAPANFTYRDIRGTCSSRISTIDGCASNSRLKFLYQACPEVPNTESREEEVQCLGSWQLQQRQYFVAKLLSRPVLHESESYRCFIYRKTSSGGLLGISADASCRELVDIDSANVRIEFQQDNYPSAQCKFSHWLRLESNSHRTKEWESLENDEKHVITESNWLILNPRTKANISTAICISEENLGNVAKFVVYRVDGCTRGYQCVKVYKRSSPHHQVIELIRGLIAPTQYQACTQEYLTDDLMQFETLLKVNSAEIACPNKGNRFKIQGCDEASSSISFGCSNHNQFVISHQCQSDRIETFNCHGHWHENGLNYLVVKEQHTGKKSCFIYSKRGEILSMSGFYRHPCKRGILPGINGHKTYNISSYGPDSCDPSWAPLNSSSRMVIGAVSLIICLMGLLLQ